MPGSVLAAWADGRFDLIASPGWLFELNGIVGREKLARAIDAELLAQVRSLIRTEAVLFDDPAPLPGATPDPGDDFLVALARVARADAIVSGDAHLLRLPDPEPPVLSPRQLVILLDAQERRRRPAPRGAS